MNVETCEQYRSIDLAELSAFRHVKPGYRGSIKWLRGDRETGRVDYRIERDGIRLMYKTRSPGRDWKHIEELILFTCTFTNFGGIRRWFECPRCQRRCRVLYGGDYFRCRVCRNLKYESQYEHPIERISGQRHKLRHRLGYSGHLDDAFPPKPKGMHWRTYQRLEGKDLRLAILWTDQVEAWLETRERQIQTIEVSASDT